MKNEMAKIEGYSGSELGSTRYKDFKREEEQYFWAVDLWWSIKNRENKFRYAIAILKEAPIDDLPYLRYLGAGMLEDLTGKSLLELFDFVEELEFDEESIIEKKLCSALRGYRFDKNCIPIESLRAEKALVARIQKHFSDFDPY